MLLGAARHLCETRNFRGAVAMVFQPAEEGGGGGREMVEDGLMERFAIERVFSLHNMPGIRAGEFAIRSGPFCAAMDEITIKVKGRGGHAAMPHLAVDPVYVGANIVTALQGIVSRNTDPLDSLIISITKFHVGEVINVIEPEARLAGTVRTLSKKVRDHTEARIRETATGIARTLGADAEVTYTRHYPVMVNDEAETRFAAAVASDVVGASKVDTNLPPEMGADDFAFMLESRPGAMIYLGNGDGPFLHHPQYAFNDETIPQGVSFWVRLAEMALKP
jgi:amidohydrolase